MKALVLSGGSIKGAYQAGAIAAVLETGWRPDIITGISVGALNAAYLATHQPLNAAFGPLLVDFWRTKITSPAVVVKKRGVIELAYRFLFKKWDGLVSTAPLEALIRKELGGLFPAPAGGAQTVVGAVNLSTGALEYTPSVAPWFLDAVLASTAEPLIMPLRRVKGAMYYDGGLRDIAPLKQAITMGATEVIAVLCQPEHDAPVNITAGSVLQLAEQVMGIATNEIITNDIGVFTGVNDLVRAAPQAAPGKRYIPLTVIRPATALGISIEAFTPADIQSMIDQGGRDARAALAVARAA